MWGSEVMVAPVMEKGATSRTVVFPDSSPVWIDMNNGTTYPGGTSATVDAPLNVLPHYARAGAFIPMANYNMKSTRDYRTDHYTINYYPVAGVASEYTLFEDDRTTPSAKSLNDGLKIHFVGDADTRKAVIDISSTGGYDGMDGHNGVKGQKALTFVIHGVMKEPWYALVNGQNAHIDYDPVKHTVTVGLSYTVGTDAKVEIAIENGYIFKS